MNRAGCTTNRKALCLADEMKVVGLHCDFRIDRKKGLPEKKKTFKREVCQSQPNVNIRISRRLTISTMIEKRVSFTLLYFRSIIGLFMGQNGHLFQICKPFL